VKFLRHLAAVLLVVAIIVGLGLLWAHASGSGTAIGGGIRRAPSPEVLRRLDQAKAGVITGQSDDGFDLANAGNLIRTGEIEAILAAVVITASAVQRRRRRTRRAAAGPDAPHPAA
jgi:hypothetical protein